MAGTHTRSENVSVKVTKEFANRTLRGVSAALPVRRRQRTIVWYRVGDRQNGPVAVLPLVVRQHLTTTVRDLSIRVLRVVETLEVVRLGQQFDALPLSHRLHLFPMYL